MTDGDQTSYVGAELTAVVVAVRDGQPYVLTVESPDRAVAALPSGPLQSSHKTLQAGLRTWVEKQTNQRLGYVEQLYTFGDCAADSAQDQRVLSIAYLALVSIAGDDIANRGRWRRWYAFFPWEDRRAGEPPARSDLLNRLGGWVRDTGRGQDPGRAERMNLTFGASGAPWDEERALERYEMLYEAGLVTEAAIDRGLPPSDVAVGLGVAMAADHRRILATALTRLRAKIKYRPVLFELMPATFTLLQLQTTAEALSGIALHKQNFRRLVIQQGLVEESGEVATGTAGRPAKLMRFRREVTLERPSPGIRIKATRRGS